MISYRAEVSNINQLSVGSHISAIDNEQHRVLIFEILNEKINELSCENNYSY